VLFTRGYSKLAKSHQAATCDAYRVTGIAGFGSLLTMTMVPKLPMGDARSSSRYVDFQPSLGRRELHAADSLATHIVLSPKTLSQASISTLSSLAGGVDPRNSNVSAGRAAALRPWPR